MSRRSTGRKLCMQLIYQMEVRHEESETTTDPFFETESYEEETIGWAKSFSDAVWAFHNDADVLIAEYAIDWSSDRIHPVDKSILRIAFYELIQTDTPHHVVLNEAVELAKTFSTDDSSRFINGILGKYVRDNGLSADEKGHSDKE
jgi:transcription antitermination protein NusB